MTAGFSEAAVDDKLGEYLAPADGLKNTTNISSCFLGKIESFCLTLGNNDVVYM